MSDPEVHIVAWEAAGLIDAPLAARLRAASAASAATAGRPAAGPAPGIVSPASAGPVFGPIVTIGEVFVLRLADPERLELLLAEGEDLHEPLVAAIESQLRRTSSEVSV